MLLRRGKHEEGESTASVPCAPCATATASPGQHGAGHSSGTAPSTPLAAYGGEVWGKSANRPPSTRFGQPEQGERSPSPLLLATCDEAAGWAPRLSPGAGDALPS